MLDVWIDVASGPLLRFSLLVMALGLARGLVLQVVELAIARSRAGDPVVAWPVVARRTLGWAVPVAALRRRDRTMYNLASMVFHVGVIVIPLSLWGHVALWPAPIAERLPVLPPLSADVLTVVAAVALVWLLGERAARPAMRALTGAQDWFLPALCLFLFVTGFAVAHPDTSPVGARTVFLLHLVSGNLLLILVPFSKLQHMVLFWTTQTSTEMGWRFTPGAGERVRLSLGKQEQRI